MASSSISNNSIYNAFERMWQHIIAKLGEKADLAHTHTNATQTNAGFMSIEDKQKLDCGGNCIATTSGSGSAYTVGINGITELVDGMRITIIPHMNCTVRTPTLKINNLTACEIRTRASNVSTSHDGSSINNGLSSGWITGGHPITLMYSDRYNCWIAVDYIRTESKNLIGSVPVSKGGTGYTSLDDTTYTTSRYRGSALYDEANIVAPTQNGVINWMYE